ncbi:entericidin A/B family lipoprotein [Methylovulum sp.]
MVIAAILAIPAYNTIHGIGKDLERVGEAIGRS